MKNPLTPTGIEPATFRFVAQHRNHCATAVPLLLRIFIKYTVQINNVNSLLFNKVPYIFFMRITQNYHVILDNSAFAEPKVGQSVGAGC